MFFRKFIILNKQNSKDVKGHARLEVRGTKARLSLSLEGAKFKENIKYRAYFAMNEQNGFREISLGIIDINKSGRGKLDLSFNPKSVNESKIDMNSLNILTIKEENIETMNEDIVLGGYIHKEDDSIGKLMNKTSKTNKANQERLQNKKKIKESIKLSESIEKKEDIEKSKGKQEQLKDKKENIEIKKKVKQAKEEIKTEEKPKETSKETSKEKPDKEAEEKTEIKTQVKEQIKTEAEIEPTKTLENQNQEDHKVKTESIDKESKKASTKDYNQQVANYTLDTLENFKEIQPFKTEERNQRWWRITPNKSKHQRGFLPYHNYILNQPCQKQVNSYNNYLFGVAENEGKITHYIYGIPGRYRKSEHPYQGKTGFITWLEDKEEIGNGYWLSYIDINTGNVVRPL